jgi:hypothetical protein
VVVAVAATRNEDHDTSYTSVSPTLKGTDASAGFCTRPALAGGRGVADGGCEAAGEVNASRLSTAAAANLITPIVPRATEYNRATFVKGCDL